MGGLLDRGNVLTVEGDIERADKMGGTLEDIRKRELREVFDFKEEIYKRVKDFLDLLSEEVTVDYLSEALDDLNISYDVYDTLYNLRDLLNAIYIRDGRYLIENYEQKYLGDLMDLVKYLYTKLEKPGNSRFMRNLIIGGIKKRREGKILDNDEVESLLEGLEKGGLEGLEKD